MKKWYTFSIVDLRTGNAREFTCRAYNVVHAEYMAQETAWTIFPDRRCYELTIDIRRGF